ncbi:hypothetical protein SRABI118_02560 [Massilia sp. Bi118]|uniref:hypothetical protein n=1 Tax=Massilia sp. Bi118 TaxID=2822346 RepID=UPI001D27A877|nr:hypothetical protein [Massilia sp. Bi118]CAH0234666.1 hypothetical protein SRABI118_02560 [Massilia sp. Bi118]
MKALTMRCAVILLGLVVSTTANADMPSTKRTKQQKTFAFGDIRIEQSFDSTKDPMSPDFTVQVYDKGRLLLQLNDAAFDTFHAAPNGEAFVGLSNSGWPGTAVIIFDRRGRILLLAEHRFARFDYCMETSTFLKQWYDPEDPHVTFPPVDLSADKEPGITIKDCRGKTIDLLDTVLKATAHGDMSLRRLINLMYGTP